MSPTPASAIARGNRGGKRRRQPRPVCERGQTIRHPMEGDAGGQKDDRPQIEAMTRRSKGVDMQYGGESGDANGEQG